MAAIRGREYVGVFFPSTQWVGLPLYKFSCLLHKLNDSGGCVVFAALLCRPAANPTPELNVDHIIIIIIIFICQNKHKQLQPTVFTIRQPENRTINKSGCLWLPLKYGINYTMNKTKKITLNVRSKVQKVPRLQYQSTKSTIINICDLVVKYNFNFF